MKKGSGIFPAILLAVLICGCSDEKKDQAPKIRERMYPKITGHSLQLKLLSTRGEYYREEGTPVLRFVLKNEGLGTVSIREWKAHDAENIRLCYAICPKRGGSAMIPAKDWKTSAVPSGKQTVRYPIELGPQNAVMVDVPMTFLPEIKKPCTIAVRGETNLQSLELKSLPVELTIR